LHTRIGDALRDAVMDAAPSAKLKTWPEGNWLLTLNNAELEFLPFVKTPSEPWEGWQPPAFEVVAHGGLGVTIPANHHGYAGRSHSLWYCDAREAGRFQWFETAFMVSAFSRNATARAPFARSPGVEAAKALWNGRCREVGRRAILRRAEGGQQSGSARLRPAGGANVIMCLTPPSVTGLSATARTAVCPARTRLPGSPHTFYGNILIFAAILAMDEADVDHGRAIVVELGVAFSTFLAHVFSEVIARNVRSGAPTTRSDVLHELRDSIPIITSAVVPCLLLAAGAVQWLPVPMSIAASQVYLFVRLALVGFVVERLLARRASTHTLLAGVLMALIAAGIALLKVTLSY
jgi:hypothetical protein